MAHLLDNAANSPRVMLSNTSAQSAYILGIPGGYYSFALHHGTNFAFIGSALTATPETATYTPITTWDLTNNLISNTLSVKAPEFHTSKNVYSVAGNNVFDTAYTFTGGTVEQGRFSVHFGANWACFADYIKEWDGGTNALTFYNKQCTCGGSCDIQATGGLYMQVKHSLGSPLTIKANKTAFLTGTN